MIGQTISHYQILEKLGEGGMGVVYKAKDIKLDRFVALKFLPDRVSAEDTAKARFLQEARAVAGLNHPHICTIYGVEEVNESVFMVMEYIEGGTLRTRLPYKKMDDALNAAIQICDALHDAHDKGIVHRDIKADNVMINAKGQIKVMDFGLAKLKGAIKLTRTSSTVGTLGYMAPEQIQGAETDPRSDIFSMGVLLFEMLTGKLPFRGDHEAAMMYSILNEDPESIETLIPEASPELSHIINRALEKDPEDRYQSFTDMMSEIRRLLKHSTQTHSVSEARKMQSDTKVQSGMHQKSGHPPVTVPKNRIGMVGGLAVVILLLVAAAYYFFPKPEAIPFENSKFTQLSYSGKVSSAAYSPDGRYIAYTEISESKMSMWVRQMATGSTIQIIPPTTEGMSFMSFSPDGNFIYFRKNPEQSSRELHRIPVLGGPTVKILDTPSSKISFSPDGKQITFLRYNASTGDYSILLANADGSNEKVLANRKGEEWYLGDPAWSPTDNIIVLGFGNNDGGYRIRLVGIDIETGTEQILSEHNWGRVGDIFWKSDGSGFFLLGMEPDDIKTGLFYVQYPTGSVKRITNDVNNYTSASITSDGQKICVTKVEVNSKLVLATDGKEANVTPLTEQSMDGRAGIAISQNQTIVYSSMIGNDLQIFRINPDKSGKQQLTSDAGIKFDYSIHPDGKHVVYAYYSKFSAPLIYQIPLQGGPAKQLTFDSEDINPVMHPSGQWVILSSWFPGTQNIMKVSIEDKQRIDLSKMPGDSPVLSPDGQTVYFVHSDNNNPFKQLYSVSIDGGPAQRHFHFAKDYASVGAGIKWRPSHNQISFIRHQNGMENIWVINPDSSGLSQYTDFTTDFIAEFDWMPNGKDIVATKGNYITDVVVIEDLGADHK